MSSAQKVQYTFKGLFDKILAFILLVIFSPILILISILIKLDSKGPAIFKQQRLGRNGRVFTIYKFRTMRDNAVNMGDGIFTSKNDKRITRMGKLLRKTSLDEVPQVLNILKGEMSFVGPRPPLVDHPYKYENYDEKQKQRFVILPGISGYAQAYGRNALPWPERIEMDIFYYYNFSLLLDIKIIVATFLTVITSKGTYSTRSNKEKKAE